MSTNARKAEETEECYFCGGTEFKTYGSGSHMSGGLICANPNCNEPVDMDDSLYDNDMYILD